MVNEQICRCCDGRDFKTLYKSSNESVKKCLNCGVIFTEIMGEKPSFKDFYDQDYYEKWSKESFQRKKMWQGRFRQLQKRCHNGALLDIGCGLGDFIIIAKQKGWDVQGVELSSYAAKYVTNKEKIKVLCGEIQPGSFAAGAFDVVTMWHALEHVDSPGEILRTIKPILKKDGMLVIEVPNAYYLVQLIKNYLNSRNIFSSFVVQGQAEPHFFHFSVNSLRKILQDAGFVVQRVYVGTYGGHQKGLLRKLKSSFYNAVTVFVYLVTGINIGVVTRIYARKCK